MGQRLIINIRNSVNDKDTLLTIYYHWSGFTRDALYITKSIGDLLEKEKPKNIVELIHNVISKVEKYPAKVVVKKRNQTKEVTEIINSLTDLGHEFTSDEKYIFEKDTNRNDGLIHIAKEEFDEIVEYGAGEVIIILNKDSVFFDVLYTEYQGTKIYKEIKESNNYVITNELKDFDPLDTNWKDINKFYEVVFEQMKPTESVLYNSDQDVFYNFLS